MHLLLLDNYDSFTFNLRHYLEKGGARCTVLRNDEPEEKMADFSPFDGIVISPGPGTPDTAGNLMRLLGSWLGQKPVYGVCLGMQAIALHYGASLVKAAKPMHGKISFPGHNGHPMFDQVSSPFQVCRYHSLVVTDLPANFPFHITAHCNNEIMALAHRSLPVWGVQFHPEAILTPQGQVMVDNWLNQLIKSA